MSPELYRSTTKALALPLACCWALACWLIARDHELFGAGLFVASSAAAVLTAHWLGWRRGTVIIDGRRVDTPAREQAASSSSPRLSLVGALALMLAITTGCPPGDEETTPPEDEGATTGQTDPGPDPAAQGT